MVFFKQIIFTTAVLAIVLSSPTIAHSGGPRIWELGVQNIKG